ncbi:MAG: M28 family metallopeptidase [Anaerolineae bacterium]
MSEQKRPTRQRVLLLVLAALVLVLVVGTAWVLGSGWIGVQVAPPTAVAPATLAPTQEPTTPPEPSPNALDIARRFDADLALQTVRDLTAPEFAGRQGGSPGAAAAAVYLARRFEELGLQPAGDDGYYQRVPLPYAEFTAVPTFRARRVDGTRLDLDFRVGFAPLWGGYAGGGVAEGRLIWVGRGTRATYEGLDVAGQIVVVEGRPTDEMLRLAVAQGARGLVALTAEEHLVTARRSYREPPQGEERLVAVYVTRAAFAGLLEGGPQTLADVRAQETPVRLGLSVRIEVPLEEQAEAEGRNVLGVLPGADPARRDEVVIIGAHYDHLGTDPQGDVYHGANDNASGVAVMLEIARVWQEAGYRPARTVLFAAWDGEEQALFGSRRYVQEPTFPLSQTVAMIQLDMVGLASEGVLTVAGLESAQVDAEGHVQLDSVTNPAARAVLVSAGHLGVPARPVSFPGGSDHAPFLSAGVSATLLIWDDAEVPYYHTPEDMWQSLQPERLEQAGAVAAEAAMALADEPVDVTALLLRYLTVRGMVAVPTG